MEIQIITLNTHWSIPAGLLLLTIFAFAWYFMRREEKEVLKHMKHNEKMHKQSPDYRSIRMANLYKR